MKRAITCLISTGLLLALCACENPGNPTVNGGYIWENSNNHNQAESVQYDLSYSYTLNRNIADTLAAQQKEGLTEERLELAQEILAELDKYPEYSDDANINYVIKLRNVYSCVVGFYYRNSTDDYLNAIIAEYDNAYSQLPDDAKSFYVRIKPSLFTEAAKQFAEYGNQNTNP